MFVISLNSSNVINDGYNNKLLYNFPSTVNLKDKYVALSNVSLYYSWFNITTTLGNNTLIYNWISGSTTTEYTIVIPDGLYEIANLNTYFQSIMIVNGTYWVDNGNNYFPFEIIVNPSRYAVQLNTYYVSSSAYPTATAPSAGWPSSGHEFNTVVVFPQNFNQIVGYIGTLPFSSSQNIANSTVPNSSYYSESKDSKNTLSYLSNVAPNVQPNGTVIFNLSGISNPYSNPSSVIYSMPVNAVIGSQISTTPPNFIWAKFTDGTYSSLTLTLTGPSGTQLAIRDTNMTITLVIKDINESAGK